MGLDVLPHAFWPLYFLAFMLSGPHAFWLDSFAKKDFCGVSAMPQEPSFAIAGGMCTYLVISFTCRSAYSPQRMMSTSTAAMPV